MAQLEKLTPEQKKLYESLMAYDSVMTDWLDAKEENREMFRHNPIKAFLYATGMEKGQFLTMASFPDGSKVLSEYMDGGNDFELGEAKTSYTNGWDIVNLATVEVINLAFKKMFGDGIDKDLNIKSDTNSADLSIKMHIEPIEITGINGSLATMKIMLKNCMVTGTMEGDPVDEVIDEIAVGFAIELQQVALQTESGETLDLYLDFQKKDAISEVTVEVKCSNKLLRYVLEGILRDNIQKIIDSIVEGTSYKICSIAMDEEKMQNADWIIPDYARFSGSSVAMADGEFKKEAAVFAKTLDKDVTDLPLNIEQQFADSSADGTLGMAERLTLGHILPIILTQASDNDDGAVSMEYDKSENCLKIDKTVSINQSGAEVKIKDFKVSSRENGFRLAFYIDGNWGAGMVKFHGTGYCDMKLEFVKKENGESQLLASVSNPELDYDVSVPWWEYVIIICLSAFLGGLFADILMLILDAAMIAIKCIFNDIQENGIDGLPIDVALPVEWNNLEFLDIESMKFSKGIHISYSMKVNQESLG